jgi:arginine-tRNA-protein transferase
VADFTWRRGWRRILKANANLRGDIRPSRATAEAFDLFHRYQVSRHGFDGMGAMTFSDFRAMVEDSPAPASLIEHRDETGQLLAVLLADHVTDGWSAVYSFFEPEMPKRSLGTYIILDLIRRSAAENRPFAYLGYWVSSSPKMAYKRRFDPIEMLESDGWRRIASPLTVPIIPANRAS